MEVTVNVKELIGEPEYVQQRIIAEICDRLDAKIVPKIEKLIDESIRAEVEANVAQIIKTALDMEYQKVGSFGVKGETTTIRNEIAEQVQKQCVFSKDAYGGKNKFSEAVFKAVGEEVQKFQYLFNEEVNKKFLDDCQQYAIEQMQKRLNMEPKPKTRRY